MSIIRRALGASIALAAIVTTITACAGAPALPVPGGPLVTVTTRGGHCVDGPCGSTIVIARDGSVTQTEPVAATLGTVPPEVLAGLDTAVTTTDFDVIRARPFTGECPVNFDGQEVIFEFGAPGGVERIATCESDIDPAHPAIAATAAAVTAVGAVVPLEVP